MSGVRAALSRLLLRLLAWLAPDEARFFDEDADRVTPEAWAGMLVLHAEAYHGCEHTAQARDELGMVGPRG